MTTKQYALIGVLGVAAVVFLVDRVFLGEPESASAEEVEPQPRRPRTPSAPEAKQKPQAFDPSLSWLEALPETPAAARNVFALTAPPGQEELDREAAEEMEAERTRPDPGRAFAETHELQGTFVSDGVLLAIINGRVIRLNDVIAGFRVDAIEPHRVQFRRGGHWISLAMPMAGDAR